MPSGRARPSLLDRRPFAVCSLCSSGASLFTPFSALLSAIRSIMEGAFDDRLYDRSFFEQTPLFHLSDPCGQSTAAAVPDSPNQPLRRVKNGRVMVDTTKRNRSNNKERRRNCAINDAFCQLQRLMPYMPTDQKLPKIKTLRLALKYIELLRNILINDQQNVVQPFLGSPRPLAVEDFAPIVAAEIQSRNSYKHRAERMLEDTRNHSDETSSPVSSGASGKGSDCACCHMY
uniref:BHLH domain-containing protein n=1 Tax=Plectus sambesii TaxID=2011161 RepID=A0A914WY53_9BILA